MNNASINIQSALLDHHKTIFNLIREIDWLNQEAESAKENNRINKNDLAEIEQKKLNLRSDIDKLIKVLEGTL